MAGITLDFFGIQRLFAHDIELSPGNGAVGNGEITRTAAKG